MTRMSKLVLASVGQGKRGIDPASVTAAVLAADPTASTDDIWQELKRLRDTGLVEERELQRGYGYGYYVYRKARGKDEK